MAYINPSPGVDNSEVTVTLRINGETGTGNVVVVPALQNITLNNSNDLFSWSQLDEGSKFQVPTTSTNTVDMTIVVDPTTFFGTGNTAPITGVTKARGILGLSKSKSKVDFEVRFNTVLDAAGNVSTSKFVSGVAYISNLAPTLTAEQPVWTTPISLAVSGDYTVSTATTIS